MKYIKTIMILGVFLAFPVVSAQEDNDEIEEVVGTIVTADGLIGDA